MKTIPPSAQTQIDKQYGARPIMVVDIYWTDIPTSYSSDTSLGEKRLMSVANITQTGSMSQITDVSDTIVKLSDHDGELKAIFNTNPMLYKRCVIKQVFKNGTTYSDPITLLDGKINSPISWDEEERTLTISVVGKVESQPITVLPDLYDRCVIDYPPMCFGTVIGVKATNITCELDSINLEAICENVVGKMTSRTANIRTQTDVFKVSNPQNYPTGTIKIQVEGTLFKGHIEGNKFHVEGIQHGFNQSYGRVIINPRQNADDDPDYNNPSVFWCSDSTGLLRNRYVKIRYDVSDVYGLEVEGGGRYQEADQFTAGAKSLSNRHFSYNKVTSQEGWKCTLENPITDRFGRPLLLGEDPRLSNEAVLEICGQYELGGRWPGNLQYNQPPYWYIPPGSQIYLYQLEEGVTYCVNSIPSTEIYGLFGMKRGLLAPIETSKYTFKLNDPDFYNGTTVKFNYHLTQYSQGWDSNEIYAALKSSVGPNVVDVIEHIVTNYLKKVDGTFCTVDDISFEYVHVLDSVKNYPVGFALFNEHDALDLLNQICWEAHLGLTIRNGVAYLSNLAEDFTGNPVDFTFNKDNTEFNSCDIELTDISNIYTRLIGYWKENYYPFTQENRTIISQNTDIFETLDMEHTYLIYNIYECVLRSLEFWLERNANVWHELTISNFLYGIGVDPYDIVGIDLPFTDDIKGQILEYDLDSSNMSITVKIWLPTSPSGGDAFPDIFNDNPDVILEEQFEELEDFKNWTPIGYLPMIMPGLARRDNSLNPAIREGERNYYDTGENITRRFRIKEYDAKSRIAICEPTSIGSKEEIDQIVANSGNPNSDGTEIQVYIPPGKSARIGDIIHAAFGARQAIVKED